MLRRLQMTVLVGLLGLPIGTAPAAAQNTPETKGLAIAQEADRRDTGFQDWAAELQMILRNSHGEESRRDLRMRSLEVTGDGDKSLVIFDRPADVQGTALLTYTHKKGDDDQWLYLPALSRVKRISSNNKSGPFMGSEFAYEDFSSQEVEKYTYKYLRDETLHEKPCFVVERYPVDPRSGYTRQVVWIDQAEYRVWKVEFYDRKKQHLKTLVLEGYQQYEKKFWRADRLSMVNHQTNKSTDLAWSNYKFKNGFKESEFDQNSLKRAR